MPENKRFCVTVATVDTDPESTRALGKVTHHVEAEDDHRAVEMVDALCGVRRVLSVEEAVAGKWVRVPDWEPLS